MPRSLRDFAEGSAPGSKVKGGSFKSLEQPGIPREISNIRTQVFIFVAKKVNLIRILAEKRVALQIEIFRNILVGFLLETLADQYDYDMERVLEVLEKIKDNSTA